MNEISVHLLLVLMCGIISIVTPEEFPTLAHLKSSTLPKDQSQAVKDLIYRAVGPRASEFNVTVNPDVGPQNRDTFILQSKSNIILITGTSGVAAAWGFYYYLSQYCNCHISWAGDQLYLPETLPPLPEGGITITSNDRFRYYQNVCTVSYSFAFWNWTRWERELDWMAMNGINLPLAFTAQEAIWQRVLLSMGFTQSELDSHFGGAAFLAWSRMGNMHGWGGPLPQSWHTQQLALQHKILDRMRAFGMVPVLPAFSGFVPDAIRRVFPSAKVSQMGDWGGFSKQYCCMVLLDEEDPLFSTFGKSFIEAYVAEFGTDHIYNTDTFNENQPVSSDPSYIRRAGRAVYDAMVAGDPDAIWLMQGWLFFSDESFWQPAQAEALLTSVPQGKMIVLDLTSENHPQYERLNSFYGQPFIWCMVNNFGGTLSMFGTFESVNACPIKARKFVNSTMIGIGLTMEGIDQNDVMYEFMLENSWREQPRDLDQWIQNYAKRRYGNVSVNANYAWQIFKSTVYNSTDNLEHHNRIGFVHRPTVHAKFDVWYSVEDFFDAWDHMILASQNLSGSMLFRYDLIDVTRQSVQLVFMLYYNEVLKYYHEKNFAQFRYYGAQLLQLVVDLDRMLRSDHHFLLGNWLESAKAMSTDDMEKQLYEYNARNQITLWGPDGNILDYANKQWAGLVQAYYFPRWQLFLDELALHWNTTFDEKQFNSKVFKTVEEPFTFDRTVFPTTTTGDQVVIATEIHKRYRPITRQHFSFFDRLYKNLDMTYNRVQDARSSSSGDWTLSAKNRVKEINKIQRINPEALTDYKSSRL